MLPVDVDPDDGGPVWGARAGTPLVPGQLAWAPLATGHRCQVWLCWSVQLWAPTLVKVVRPGWSGRHWTRALGREARALRGLQHPAFPRLLGDHRSSELPHLVLEYLDGPNLHQLLQRDGPLPAADAARLGVGLLAAVRALHASGTAHLDISVNNVLIVDRRVRLVDLGAARPLGRLLRRGEYVGTDDFIAPELLDAPGGAVTAAMDVFSVGAVLRAVVDPEDAHRGFRGVLAELTAADPGRRPDVDRALGRLVRHAGRGALRPWPTWADGALEPAATDPLAVPSFAVRP